MTFRHHLSNEMRVRAFGSLEAGQSQTEMARWLNVCHSVIHRLWQQFLTMNWAFRSFSQGRPRATTSASDRYLSLCARRNKYATPFEIRSSLAASSRRLVSRSTVCQRLHEHGPYAR
ncbi:HTH_Tnp_Tc3_2 domain-containing protein [Trichonephila clavipes]|nr:HTH_Tnp_Tc3_2 domain-containing protein [Trichonephila clavipes]